MFETIKESESITAAAAKSLQSCSTLCDPIDGSPRGSSVPGILQARTLEWVAISDDKNNRGRERKTIHFISKNITVKKESLKDLLMAQEAQFKKKVKKKMDLKKLLKMQHRETRRGNI